MTRFIERYLTTVYPEQDTTIENSFGILSARWRTCRQPNKVKVENAEKYAVAAIALHNYLRMTNNASYSPTVFNDIETNYGEIVPGAWSRVITNDGAAGPLRNLPNVKGSKYQTCAVTQRDNFQSYFMNTGAVDWQVNHVTSCGPIVTV